MVDDKNSDAKLLEISREAHKLTQMIRSWPKAPDIDSRWKDITKDLVKGASGLQESLITIGKMSRTPKEKFDLDFTRGSGRFERLAMDGSLFNYIDELKELIRENGYSHRHGIVHNDDEKVSSSCPFGLSMKKEKGPNLIAKLMGLEELPSGSNSRALKETNGDRCLVPKKSILAIEMPKTRMLITSMEEKPEPRTKKTVKDIVEIVKSKEALESDKIKKHKRMPCSVPCNGAPTEFDRIVVLKKTQATNPITEKVVCCNQQTLSRKTEGNEVKNVQKNIVTPYQKTANLASIDRRQQKRKVLTNTSIKGNASSKQLMKGRKPEDRKELKVFEAPKSQARLISKAPAKSGKKRSIIINKDISSNDQPVVFKGSFASRKHNETSTIKPMPRNFTDLATVKKKKEAKLIRKSMDIKAVASNANCKVVQVTNRSSNFLVGAPATQLEQNTRPYNTEDKTSKESKLSCEAVLKNSKVDRSSSEESIRLPKNKTNLQTETKEEVDVQLVLLSSQCFLSNAQELFGLDGYQTTNHLQVKTRNAELLFGCVKEFMVRRKNGIELSKHQMLQTCLRSTAITSIDRLADEMSREIEKLTAYSKSDVGISLKDGIYVTLEKDIRCNDVMLNAMWDMGWVNWICVEEVDTVVGQVEELILHELVKELAEELVLGDSSL